MVMGGDSCYENNEFESQHHILNMFSHIFFVKIVMFSRKDENKRKKAGDGPFLKEIVQQHDLGPIVKRFLASILRLLIG